MKWMKHVAKSLNEVDVEHLCLNHLYYVMFFFWMTWRLISLGLHDGFLFGFCRWMWLRLADHLIDSVSKLIIPDETGMLSLRGVF